MLIFIDMFQSAVPPTSVHNTRIQKTRKQFHKMYNYNQQTLQLTFEALPVAIKYQIMTWKTHR